LFSKLKLWQFFAGFARVVVAGAAGPSSSCFEGFGQLLELIIESRELKHFVIASASFKTVRFTLRL